MLLEEQDDFASSAPASPNPPLHAAATTSSSTSKVHYRTVHFQGQALRLETRWGVGIGGDIWTTASLLCQFLERHHAFFQRAFAGRRILCVVCLSVQCGGLGWMDSIERTSKASSI